MRNIIFIFFLLISGYIKGETVFGKVTDENNYPLPFVTITVEGKSLGTMSDFDGKYTLELPDEKNTIVFSFIGYSNVIIETTGGELNVTMGIKTELLEAAEVVERANRNNETILLLDKKEDMNVETSVVLQN